MHAPYVTHSLGICSNSFHLQDFHSPEATSRKEPRTGEPIDENTLDINVLPTIGVLQFDQDKSSGPFEQLAKRPFFAPLK